MQKRKQNKIQENIGLLGSKETKIVYQESGEEQQDRELLTEQKDEPHNGFNHIQIFTMRLALLEYWVLKPHCSGSKREDEN